MRLLKKIARQLPEPLILFALLALITIVLSAIAAQLNLSAINPGDRNTIEAVSLLSGEGIHRIVSEAVTNFVEFPPLGVVLVAMLGVGVAESSGLLAAAIAINTDEEIERNSTAIERRGLRWAGYALFIFIAIVLGMLLPPEGVLRDPTQLTTDRYWEINCVDVALCDRFFVGLVGVVNGLVCVRSAFGRWGGDVFGVESSE